jgi:hypothetical protein
MSGWWFADRNGADTDADSNGAADLAFWFRRATYWDRATKYRWAAD